MGAETKNLYRDPSLKGCNPPNGRKSNRKMWKCVFKICRIYKLQQDASDINILFLKNQEKCCSSATLHQQQNIFTLQCVWDIKVAESGVCDVNRRSAETSSFRRWGPVSDDDVCMTQIWCPASQLLITKLLMAVAHHLTELLPQICWHSFF